MYVTPNDGNIDIPIYLIATQQGAHSSIWRHQNHRRAEQPYHFLEKMGFFTECIICPLNGEDCFVADAWLTPQGIWDASWTEAGKKVRKIHLESMAIPLASLIGIAFYLNKFTFCNNRYNYTDLTL